MRDRHGSPGRDLFIVRVTGRSLSKAEHYGIVLFQALGYNNLRVFLAFGKRGYLTYFNGATMSRNRPDYVP